MPGLPLTQFRVVFDVSVENSWNKWNVWKGIPIFLVGKFQAEIGISCLQTFFWILVSGFRGRFSLNETDLGKCKRDYRTESKFIGPEFCSPLPKPWSDHFTRVNSRKALCPKACDTASSHRYLPLGTFRQRAVRGRCIAEYALYIIVDRSNGRSLHAISLITF